MATAFTPPTIAQFQAQFPNDWPYGPGTDKVTPGLIQGAFNEAFQNFDPCLFSNTPPPFAASITGTTVISTPNVTALSSAYGLAPGQTIVGAGIPVNTTILSVAGASLVLSANATASAAGVALAIAGASPVCMPESVIAYCFLAAHLLALNVQNAGGLGAPPSFQGLGSSGGGIVESKTVGSVSVSYAIPDRIKNSPILGQYMRTGYGQKYLIMVAPKLPGRRVMVVGGEPSPFAPAVPNFGQPFIR